MASTGQPGVMSGRIRVEVIRADRNHSCRVQLDLAAGATVEVAMRQSGLADVDGFSSPVAGYAVFGERAQPARELVDGDRVELLGALIADPKQARRRRASGASPAGAQG